MSNASSSTVPARSQGAGFNRTLIFLVAAAMFMENLDGTIIATALPSMGRSFGTSAVDLNLGISAYLLALGVFIPASGWVADRFGTRRIFASAIVLFTLSSVLCAWSQDLTQFVAVRVLQGMAGAMMVPVGRLVVLRDTPLERRMDAMATLIWPSLVAPVLGPPLGGFITMHLSWPWIFYLNLPLGVLAFIASLRIIPEIRAEERLPFDWIGFALCGAGIFVLMFGLDRFAQHVSVLTGAYVVAGVVLAVLAVRHFARAKHPMIELSAWRIQTFRMAMKGGSLYRMAIGSAPFLLPLLFQLGFGFSPERSGLLMLGIFGANLGMKTVTSAILRRWGFRRVLLVNGSLASVSLAACALLTAQTPIVVMLAILVLGGATRSMQFTTIGMINFADVPQKEMQGANGLSSTVSQLTMGAGIAVGAMSIRGGAAIAQGLGIGEQDASYRIAFLIVAVISLCGLIEVLQLPRDAGAKFAKG